MIGETDFTSGPATLHEKAIYIVEGQLFQVERLDFDGRKAYRPRGRLRLLHRRDHLHEGDDPGHVRVGDAEDPSDRGCQRRIGSDASTGSRSSSLGSADAMRRSHGEVHVVSRVVGFKKIKFYTNENVGSGELDLPEQQMHTSSYWLTIPAGGDGVAAVRRRRSARRRGRARVRDAATSRSCC